MTEVGTSKALIMRKQCRFTSSTKANNAKYIAFFYGVKFTSDNAVTFCLLTSNTFVTFRIAITLPPLSP